jgi:hypothetical protein
MYRQHMRLFIPQWNNYCSSSNYQDFSGQKRAEYATPSGSNNGFKMKHGGTIPLCGYNNVYATCCVYKDNNMMFLCMGADTAITNNNAVENNCNNCCVRRLLQPWLPLQSWLFRQDCGSTWSSCCGMQHTLACRPEHNKSHLTEKTLSEPKTIH